MSSAALSLSPTINNSPTINTFVVYAAQGVTLGSGDHSLGGDLGVSGAGGSITVGSFDGLDVLHTLAAPSITVGVGGIVGAVDTNALANNGGLVGTQSAYPASMPPLPAVFAATPGTTNVTVAQGHQTTLSPGSYGTLIDDGQVFLNPGTYSFSSVTLGNNAQLDALQGGSTSILISGSLATGTFAQISPVGQLANELTVSVAGSDGMSGSPPAVSVGANTQLISLLVAPNGTVSLGNNVQATGAFAGIHFVAGTNVQLNFQSGFPNATPTLSTFVAYAKQSVTLGQGDKSLGGDIGVAATAPGSFGTQLTVGAQDQLDPWHTLYAPTVSLSSHAVVGDVEANSLTNNGGFFGSQAPYPTGAMPALPPVLAATSGPPFPPVLTATSGTTNVTVAVGQQQTLSPGVFGALIDNGLLFLNPGTYAFASVTLGNNAQLQALPNGSTTIKIAGTFSIGTQAQIFPLGQPAGALTISVAGTDGSNGSPPAVSVGANSLIVALLSAPNGSLSFANNVFATGAFAGLNIAAGVNVQFNFQTGFPPTPPVSVPLSAVSAGLDPLPPPPAQPGCYIGTLNGWLSIPCSDPHSVFPGFQSFDVSADGLASVLPPAGSVVPLVYGQVESTVEAIGSEGNFISLGCKAGTMCGDGSTCPASGQCPCNAKTCSSNTCDSNGLCGTGTQWGIQLNANWFPCPSPFSGTCWDQFVLVTDGVSGSTAACIETWKGGTANWSDQNFCVASNGQTVSAGGSLSFQVSTRKGGLQAGDFGNVAAYAYTANGNALIGMVAQFSWVSSQDVQPTTETDLPNRIPGLYAVVTPDQYGLAQSWTNVAGGLMGEDNSSTAEFKNAEMLNRYAVSDCQGDVSAAGPTCPGQTTLSSSNVQYQVDGTSGETNNLSLVQTPTASFLNSNLAVTDVFSTTNTTSSGNATCLSSQPNHLYIKDTDGDNGGVPSNVGGVAFWESPDIFVVPQGAVAPGINDVAADNEIIAGQNYDVYLRVHNDYGCSPVTGPINVFIDGADPNLGFQNWSAVTTGAAMGNYTTFGASGATIVQPYGAAIIGPFPWMPSGGGHKCLLASIAANGETEPATTILPNQPVLPPAYSSNQIAQRNLQIGSSCTYSITNPNTTSANLLLGISVTPGSPAPGASGGPTVSLVIGDPGGAWAAEWMGLAGLSSVSNDGTNTTIVLNSSEIALTSVPLSGGASPSVSISILAATGTPPTVDVSAMLTNPQTGTILQQNGGSCTGTTSQVVIQ